MTSSLAGSLSPTPSHAPAPTARDEAAPRPAMANRRDTSEGGAPVRLLPRPPSRPPRSAKRLGLTVVLVLAAAAGWLGWRYGVPRPATLLTVEPTSLARELRAPGMLDALDRASVSASIQGVVEILHVDVGDRVKAGDPIAELRSDDLKAQVMASQASHSAARTAVILAQAERRRAEATRANARSTLDRQEKLIRSGATSRSALENAQTALEQSLADLARSDAAVSQAQATEAAQAATVAMNRALREKATIRAPIDGVVVARKLNTGDLVVPGTAIVELVNPASIVLSARFDESVITALALGQRAHLTFSPGGGEAISGTVRRLGREVDTETREFTVDVAPERLPKNWAMGQRGTAILSVETRESVLAVPASALAPRTQGAGLYVERNGHAAWQPVSLGVSGAGRVEVRSGLQAGDRVLLEPASAYPGMRISARAATP